MNQKFESIVDGTTFGIIADYLRNPNTPEDVAVGQPVPPSLKNSPLLARTCRFHNEPSNDTVREWKKSLNMLKSFVGLAQQRLLLMPAWLWVASHFLSLIW